MGQNELEAKCRLYKDLVRIKEKTEDELEAVKDDIKAYMKQSGKEKDTAGCFKISYKEVSKTSFDTDAFKAEHQNLYEEYNTKKSSYMQLRIS
jgi:predicted phage-related endonuclease